MADEDVPSPIDFHDPAQARDWEEQTVKNRPYRPHFFAAFADALNGQFQHPIAVLELGSGPGHLAEFVLANCTISRYAALDFSLAMHDLARARLTRFLGQVQFVQRDFRDAAWEAGLGHFDAVLTMQAAHETRHKRYLVPLLEASRACLAEGGLLLYCDHYWEAGIGKHPDLYLEREAQPEALRRSGFTRIARIRDEGGIALYAAQKG